MTMSLSTGLISGMDTGSLISQLIQAEGAPQSALKTRLAVTNTTATAYRAVNTAFLAIKDAATAARTPTSWNLTKGTSTSTGVAVNATAGATPGALTFRVPQVATTHAAVSTTRWADTTTAAGLTTLDVRTLDDTTSKGTIALDGTESLAQVVTKINASGLNLSASAVQVTPGQYALQVTSTKSGAAASFLLDGTETFAPTTVGVDAELRIGDAAGAYSVYSATNTFDDVLAGASLTVSRKETDPVTAAVASDPDAAAAKMTALVDALNSTLDTVKKQTANQPGSQATLRGDFSVTSLAGQLLDEVSRPVGSHGSPAAIGLELSRDGKITFDKEVFLTALKDTPELVQNIMVTGSPAGTGPGGEAIAAVQGIAERLLKVTKAASDSATGTLVSLANGQDSLAKDIKNRIENWDLRLAKRRQILTRQFTAMETSLSSLRNQSTWLAGQINSLPS
jgi:flagellar capping protein FliD